MADAPTIWREPYHGGWRLTCPAGHTFWYLRAPAPEVIAPWLCGHEVHEVVVQR
jgi:hypothetical protein